MVYAMEDAGNDGAPLPSLLRTAPVSGAGFLHQPIWVCYRSVAARLLRVVSSRPLAPSPHSSLTRFPVRPAHSCASPGSPTSSIDSTSQNTSAWDAPRRSIRAARWHSSGRDVCRATTPCCVARAEGVRDAGGVERRRCRGDGMRRTVAWRLGGGSAGGRRRAGVRRGSRRVRAVRAERDGGGYNLQSQCTAQS